MNRVAVILDPLYLEHSNGPGHPESRERLEAIERMLASFPARDRLEQLSARDAQFEELAWVHTPEYIRSIEATRGRPFTVLDPDTGAGPESYAAALRAAGGVLQAVDAVLEGGRSGAFALVRPPGHHAEADRAMGFCLFNNVAVAACYALRRHGLRRVLIVDWDVHHGNGTMHAFYDSPEVLYFSLHQYPHYPGTGSVQEVGRGPGAGYTMNVPLPGGQGDADYLAAFRQLLLPVAREYAPQLILVSAGFDVHQDDPLADMRVSTSGFADLTGVLRGLAAECCPGRLALALEGGYQLKALAEGVAAVLTRLLDEQPEAGSEQSGPPDAATSRVIAAVREALAPYWRWRK
jgi:acetoin utilization deacetylase AcuC-like enzyme